MTEKKTFKIGPEGYSLDHPNTAWFVVGYDTIFEEGSHWFPEDNWDVEVTFTKKRGPVESGQWREEGVVGRERGGGGFGFLRCFWGGHGDPAKPGQGRTD